MLKMRLSLSILEAFLICQASLVVAFAPSAQQRLKVVGILSVSGGEDATRLAATQLGALTERQMQFWEDVEDGLKEIEDFYKKKGEGGIDRIWKFCER